MQNRNSPVVLKVREKIRQISSAIGGVSFCRLLWTLEQFIRSEDYVLRIVGCDYFVAHFALPAEVGENTTLCIFTLKFCFRKRILICHLLQLSFKSLGRGITSRFGWNVWSERSAKKTFSHISRCIFKNVVEVKLPI